MLPFLAPCPQAEEAAAAAAAAEAERLRREAEEEAEMSDSERERRRLQAIRDALERVGPSNPSMLHGGLGDAAGMALAALQVGGFSDLGAAELSPENLGARQDSQSAKHTLPNGLPCQDK